MSRRWVACVARVSLLAVMLGSARLAGAQSPDAGPPPSTTPEGNLEPGVSGADPISEPGAAVPVEAAAGEEMQAVDPAALAAEGTLSEAELAGLGFSTEAPAVDTDIKLSGFMDFGVQTGLTGPAKELIGDPSFAIGNLNVYLSKNLTESLRTMAEIRFMYLPNGSPVSRADPTYQSTWAADYNDFSRALRWGGVEIERVYLDWTAHNYLTLRLGQFLTPYGVWNVDHGSPAIITVNRPFVIGNNYFPERQTGVELFGRWEATSYGTLGYHVTLSNGNGPISEYKDLDKNKALGARTFYEYRRLGELRIGASLYYGRNTAKRSALDTATYKVKSTITSQQDDFSLAADVTWKFGGLHLQGEWIGRQVRMTPEGRTLQFSPRQRALSYPANAFAWGMYGLVGYRFDWLGVMPYLVLQRLGGREPALQSETGALCVVTGLNVRPVDALVIKLEYTFADLPSYVIFAGGDLNILAAQVAWAF